MTRCIEITEVTCQNPAALRSAMRTWIEETREPVGLDIVYKEDKTAIIRFKQIQEVAEPRHEK